MTNPDSTFVVATTNSGKRREFQRLLAELLSSDWTVYDRHSYPEPL